MRDNWRQLPISELATFCSGGTPNKGMPDFWNGPVPWVTVKDMKVMRLNGVGESLTEEGAKTVRVVPPGTVLVLVRGMGLFKGLPVVLCNRPVAFNQDIKALIPKEGVDGEFLALSIIARQPDILRHVDTAGHGTGRLDTELLKSTPLPVPPFQQQRKIAEILRTWDEALEKLTALRAAHEDRFVGLRDALIVRASRSGRPAYFGDFLTESRAPGTDGATARKISVRLYGKGATEKNEPRSGSANTRYFRRAAGQIIWSKLDFLNGAFALIGPELDGCESTLDLPAFDCDPEVNPVWLIEYLTRPAYYTRQLHLARGQRKARRIAPDDWLASPLRLPDRATQDRVADTLACARAELALVGAEIEALTRQKRGLMQKLLTGEWRVPLDPVETPAATEETAHAG